MAEPETQMSAAAVDRGRLRVSHADRDQAIEVLKAAFVQDRLSKDEFDARIGRTLAARTCTELAAVTADIPAGLSLPRAQRKPARRRVRVQMNTAVTAGACVAVGWNFATVVALASGSAVAVVSVAVFFVVAAALALGAMIFAR